MTQARKIDLFNFLSSQGIKKIKSAGRVKMIDIALEILKSKNITCVENPPTGTLILLFKDFTK